MKNSSAPQPSIDDLLNKYQRGELSPQQNVQNLFDRIAAHDDPSIFIHLRPVEDILADAKRLTEIPKEQSNTMPLFGIPFAVKDNIDCVGIPTTAACPAFSYTPTVDAFIVSKLKEAGAILIGKTNLDQFATGLVGTRSPYGTPKNIFSSDHIPGGSSSGSAVAVAADLVAFSLGTDTAGSGRVPAAFNDLIGFKPSCGRFSTRGIVPACRSIDCPSIFTKSVDDALRIFNVLNVFDSSDPYACLFKSDAVFAEAPVTGIPGEEVLSLLSPEYRTSYLAILETLRGAGWHLREIDFEPFLASGRLLYEGAYVAERLTAIQQEIDDLREHMDETVFQIISGGQNKTAIGLFNDFHELRLFRRQAEFVMADVDTLLFPTTPFHPTLREVDADKIGINTKLGAFTNFMNLLNFAAIAIPSGFTKTNLPFGITLAALSGSDRALTRQASAFQYVLKSSTTQSENHAG